MGVAPAPSRSDPDLARQHRVLARMGEGAPERDLVLVAAVDCHPDAEVSRRRFGCHSAFRAVLVGKDGYGRLTSPHPLEPDDLFPLIDAMPMRRGGSGGRADARRSRRPADQASVRTFASRSQ